MTLPYSLSLHLPLNADLHCHSNLSDGTLTPEILAARAKANGVELWALTDHDEVAGVERAANAARSLALPFLTGVELSVSFADETVHIVALGVDIQNADLLEGMKKTRSGRLKRAQRMGDELAKAGIRGAYEGALKYVDNPETISRTHFARFLVEAGVCRSNIEVFRKYLNRGKPGYVAHGWAALGECMEWIRSAGGMAVIAHPGRYKRLSATAEHALFTEFCALGGQGVEVVTGSHSPADAIKYAQIAKDFGLLASRGSDFHAPSESRIDLGALPLLDSTLEPVWGHLAGCIQ